LEIPVDGNGWFPKLPRAKPGEEVFAALLDLVKQKSHLAEIEVRVIYCIEKSSARRSKYATLKRQLV
jgi:hypothetical protein